MRPRKGPYRVPYGGQIDRTRKIPFRFDGRTYIGHPGDTLASALLANGVRTVARSFKFHRPRGLYSCGVEEPNGLLSLGTGARVVPSERSPMVELHDGLESRSQEGWPSVDFDVGRVLDWTAPLWAAGFYNKTFIWPSWHVYEPIIRRLAGLGQAPTARDLDRYDVRNLHCDVLVVGGGVAGLGAAEEAARSGARVVLVEQDRILGGRAAWEGSLIDRTPPAEWIRAIHVRLARRPEVRLLMRTTAVGCYDHNVVVLVERAGADTTETFARRPRERLWVVRTARIVLATGAIEQPLIFCNNDRPGVMFASAVRQYLRRYGVAPGRRVLIATNNDSAYALARDLTAADVAVVAVIDSRPRQQLADRLSPRVREAAVEWVPGSIPTDTRGFGALRSVTVGRLSPDARGVEALQTFKCDALAVSGGLAPALQLYAQAGGKLAYDETSGVLRPVGSVASVEIVGTAAESISIGPRVSPTGKSRRQWVDFAHDVTVADLELAVRENYSSIEHVKRYTTVGMAVDQGKTSHAATLEVVGRLRGLAAAELAHTTLRPPVTPVTLGAIAGREVGLQFAPTRFLPMHEWHVRHGAIMQDFGGWQRPVAYVREGDTREQAAHREARVVRTACGLFDGSSLGKIEVQGPDALEFLDRFYINNLKTLQPGRVRYGLMLRETGIIFDDGTVVALAPDRLLVTTTSGNAGRVYQWLEEWRQCEWPSLRVAITPVTEQWATLSLAGPDARTILSRLDADINLSGGAFPHLAIRQGKLLDVPARIYRVSFTGELTYEINVPADSSLHLWEALLDVGLPYGLQAFGMDALMALRLEKGFLHVGADTDGTTVPDDVGWGVVAANKKGDYIGKRSLALPEHLRPDRLQLVGLRADTDTLRSFVIGSHVRLARSTRPSDGWITSAGRCVQTGEPIALAMLRGGRTHAGQTATLYDAGTPIGQAEVAPLPFFDVSGARMNG